MSNINVSVVSRSIPFDISENDFIANNLQNAVVEAKIKHINVKLLHLSTTGFDGGSVVDSSFGVTPIDLGEIL